MDNARVGPTSATEPKAAPDPRSHSPGRIDWTPGRLRLVFTASTDGPVVLSGLGCDGEVTTTGATQPLVELIATGDGRARTTTRFTEQWGRLAPALRPPQCS